MGKSTFNVNAMKSTQGSPANSATLAGLPLVALADFGDCNPANAIPWVVSDPIAVVINHVLPAEIDRACNSSEQPELEENLGLLIDRICPQKFNPVLLEKVASGDLANNRKHPERIL